MRKRKKSDDPLAALRAKKVGAVPATTSTHATVVEQEEQAAALVGGKRHAGSGAFPTLKSDASSDHYQIEAKQTNKDSLCLTLKWLEKITYEASGTGKIPLLHLRFLSIIPGKSEKDWVVMPVSEFRRLFKGRSK